MRPSLFGVFFSIFFYVSSANAWFFQPPPGSVSDETLASFREASIASLAGLVSVYEMLQVIEATDLGVNATETASVAISSLLTAVDLFANLQTNDLETLFVSTERVLDIDQNAIGLVLQAEIETAADLVRYSITQLSLIAERVQILEDRDFGPDLAGDPETRSIVNSLSVEIANMIIIANTVSGVLALQELE